MKNITAAILSYCPKVGTSNPQQTDGSDGTISLEGRYGRNINLQDTENRIIRPPLLEVGSEPSEPSETVFPATLPQTVKQASEPSEYLPPDQAPWLHIAKQILSGEFDDADGSTRDSLSTGLRSILHPVCASAIKHLWPKGMPKHLQPR